MRGHLYVLRVHTHTKTKLTQNMDYFRLIFLKKLRGKGLENKCILVGCVI